MGNLIKVTYELSMVDARELARDCVGRELAAELDR